MISIIVPVYNVEKYLDECIQSIVSQSYTDWECILIDDGSTDTSGIICDKWSKQDKRIRVIHQPNQGVSAARNNGIYEAKGNYLYFIDADDWCENNIFDNFQKYDLIIGSYYLYYLYNKNYYNQKIVFSNNYALDYLKENIICRIGSFFVKTQLIRNNNILFSTEYKYGEDLEFILKIILSSKSIKILDQPFTYYRINNNSVMNKITFERYSVFFSRLQLIEFAKIKNNYEVVEYLSNFSCIEAIIVVTRELVLHNYSINTIKSYMKKYDAFNKVLLKASKNNSLQPYFRKSAYLLFHYPSIYVLFIRFNEIMYKIRGYLGKIKQKWIK